MLAGWKDISAHLSAIAGYDVAPDAMRKIAERDDELRAIMSESVTGKPLVSEYELATWFRKRQMPRRAGIGRIVRALLDAGQLALL